MVARDLNELHARTGALSPWNSWHASQSCADTAPRGGAGRIYCFARN